MRLLRVAVGLVAVFGLVAVVLFARALSPSGSRDAAEFVSVRPGTSLRALAKELETRGAVRDARALVLWGRVRGVSTGLKAGRYRLEAAESGRSFLDKVVRGDTIPIRVSFFEGIWASEVVSLLADPCRSRRPTSRPCSRTRHFSRK